MIAGEAEAGNAPPADVAKFESAAGGDNTSQRSAASVGRAENAADACTRDAGDRNVMLLENLKNAEVGEAAGKAATEGDADTWPSGQWHRLVRFGVGFTYHGESIAIRGRGER